MAEETATIPTTTETATAAPADAAPVVEADASTDEGTLLGGAPEQAAEGEGDGGSDPKDGSDGDEAKPEGAPEAYELTAPDGFTLDAAAVEAATPIFKELNLSNEQAQKLMPVAADFAQRIQDAGQQQLLASVAEQRKAWAVEAQADEEIGKGNWDTSIAASAKALDALGFPKGSPFRALLNDSGLGNHPEMIRAFVRVGKAIGEDSDFVRVDAGAPVESNPARILYPNNPPKGA